MHKVVIRLSTLWIGFALLTLACNLPIQDTVEATPTFILQHIQAPSPQAPAGARSTATPAHATISSDTPHSPVPSMPNKPVTPTILPTQAPGTNELDRSEWRSVVEYLLEGVQRQDLAQLSSLIPPEGLTYAFYIEGGQQVTASQVLDDLQRRLPSSLTCQGMLHDENGLQVWISGWSPAWQIDEICYVECATLQPPQTSQEVGFLFFPSNGEWKLGALYLNTPEKYYFIENIQLDACPSLTTQP